MRRAVCGFVCFALIAVYRALPEGKMNLSRSGCSARVSWALLVVLSLGLRRYKCVRRSILSCENDGFHRRTAFVTDHQVAPRNSECGEQDWLSLL